MAKAIEIIHERYRHRLSLRDMADELYVSESYLARKFKECIDMTYLDFITKYRLNKAVRLMLEGGRRIGEVSDLAGFTQYKRFSVVFKRYIGMTPTEYLKKQGFGNEEP